MENVKTWIKIIETGDVCASRCGTDVAELRLMRKTRQDSWGYFTSKTTGFTRSPPRDTIFLLDLERSITARKMTQNGARHHAASSSSVQTPARPSKNSKYTQPLSKADLDASLSAIYEKLVDKLEQELHTSTNALSQEIASIRDRTDILEAKHDELGLAHNDLRKDYETLADSLSFMQAHVEDLDNRNRHNNIRVRGIPESVTDLNQAITKLFHSLVPDKLLSDFACDRLHRALWPKPTPDKPPRDVIMCIKDFVTKEDIMRASRNSPSIELDGVRLQIYPDISPATLDRRRRMKEVTSILQTARIKYWWGFPFTLSIMHNSTTYTVYNVIEGKDLLIKLGLLEQQPSYHLPATPRSSPIWSTPSSRRNQREQRKWQQLSLQDHAIIVRDGTVFFCFLCI